MEVDLYVEHDYSGGDLINAFDAFNTTCGLMSVFGEHFIEMLFNREDTISQEYILEKSKHVEQPINTNVDNSESEYDIVVKNINKEILFELFILKVFSYHS